jgi:hypothetical protein
MKMEGPNFNKIKRIGLGVVATVASLSRLEVLKPAKLALLLAMNRLSEVVRSKITPTPQISLGKS